MVKSLVALAAIADASHGLAFPMAGRDDESTKSVTNE
jgi:hypothetical protein